ncbi:sensor histidine kinase [Paenibacillus sp. Y412MC10]|uniref:sensor histidine kinase n=1 Tax=Geobacillus sp. (strain Y412MC10) TaxID=481743 RepID=UPI00119E0FDA|nr:sensor histidine kinase [Paenibacillus sp. Y412MC10]
MIRTWKNRFRQSIQLRLTGYFILILIPLVVISTFSNHRSRTILKNQIGDRTQSAMQSVVHYVDLTMQGVYELTTVLANNYDINRRFEYAGKVLTPQSILDFQWIDQQIAAISSVNRMAPKASLFHYDSGILLSTTGYQKEQNPEQLEWVKQAIEADGKITLFFPEENRYNANHMIDPIYNKNVMVVMRRMSLLNPERNKNIVILPLSKDYFVSQLRRLLPSSHAEAFLFTQDGKLIATTASSTAIPPSWPDEGKDLIAGYLPGYPERMLMVRVTSQDSGWKLVMIQPEKDILQESRTLQGWTYLIIAVSVLISLWISWIVYSGISKPMKKMVAAMKEMRRGQLDIQIIHRREDEFGYVMDTFNHLASAQRHLIEDVYEKQILLTKTEFKLLQSQINPHFLYNTLDSIYSAAVLSDADDVGEMVINLSKFLRYSLGKGKEHYTVSETFNHLNYYIKVQQRRFDFEVTYRMGEGTEDILLLKLLLQPLVENAILHGLERKHGGRALEISAVNDGEWFIAEVKDNGVGMAPDRLQYIQQQLDGISVMNWDLSAGWDRMDAELYGLRNVKSRLKLHYGENADLVIDSDELEGTRIRLYIPRVECGSIQYMEGTGHEFNDRGR